MARERMQAAVDRAERLERRAAARLDKVFAVFVDGDRGGAFGVARNISDGGMFVETHDPQPIGSQVRITFEAQGAHMTAVAEVRYVCHLIGRPRGAEARHAAVRGVGVRFLYFDPAGEAPPILQ